MKNRPMLIVGGLVGLVFVGAVAWWLLSPIFLDRTVDEAFPLETTGQTGALPTEIAMQPEVELTEQSTTVTMPTPTIPPETPTPDITATPSEPVVLAQGQFRGGERDYVAVGTATLYQLPDGSRIVRFENFEASNGPDLRVMLVANPNPTGSADKGDFVDLGVLKGNIGNQNYDIPADVDLTQYQSVIIYCRSFSALFGSATLMSK